MLCVVRLNLALHTGRTGARGAEHCGEHLRFPGGRCGIPLWVRIHHGFRALERAQPRTLPQLRRHARHRGKTTAVKVAVSGGASLRIAPFLSRIALMGTLSKQHQPPPRYLALCSSLQVKSSTAMALYNVTARVYSGGTPSVDASPTQDGASPFAPVVFPAAVSWEMSTPVDMEGVADKAGLGSAYNEATTSFEIESRDRSV